MAFLVPTCWGLLGQGHVEPGQPPAPESTSIHLSESAKLHARYGRISRMKHPIIDVLLVIDTLPGNLSPFLISASTSCPRSGESKRERKMSTATSLSAARKPDFSTEPVTKSNQRLGVSSCLLSTRSVRLFADLLVAHTHTQSSP